ncbi:MAG: type II toxin-antitoxin system HicA family toxin [Pseudomonadota bacterium]
MKLPRSLSAAQLLKGLGKLGYVEVRQTGSHVRLLCKTNGGHHLTVPLHDPLKVGTLAAILSDVAQHQGMTQSQLLQRLFDGR